MTFQNNIFNKLKKKDHNTKEIEIAEEINDPIIDNNNKKYLDNIFSNLIMNMEEKIDNSYANNIFKDLKNRKTYNIGYFVSYESEPFMEQLISLFDEERFKNYNLSLFFDNVDQNKEIINKGKIDLQYDYKRDLSNIENEYLSNNKLDLIVTMEKGEDGVDIVKRSLINNIYVLTVNSDLINELIKKDLELLGSSYLILAENENSILKKLNYFLPTLKKEQ